MLVFFKQMRKQLKIRYSFLKGNIHLSRVVFFLESKVLCLVSLCYEESKLTSKMFGI